MRDLIGQFSVVDDDAASALRVIAHFDTLADNRSGHQALARAAAVLSGHPAGLHDPARGRHHRIGPDGHPLPEAEISEAWPTVVVDEEHGTTVWLEVVDPPPILALILERYAGAVRRALDRTQHRLSYADAVRIVLDRYADDISRTAASRRLGLTGRATVLALPRDQQPPARAWSEGRLTATVDDLRATIVPGGLDDVAFPPGMRVGVARADDAGGLPTAWERARLALRMTRPGSLIGSAVDADDLGAVATVASSIGPEVAGADAEVQRLESLIGQHEWLLPTLEGVLSTSTVRQAATALHLHHSTLQERLERAEQLLGYVPTTPFGRHRLATALLLRQLAQG